MKNSDIAKVMGFEILGPCYVSDNLQKPILITHFNQADNIYHAKLLQAKMVEDGWHVEIQQHAVNSFRAIAWTDIWEGNKYITEVEHNVINADTEPAAIVSLFKKVYGGGG